MSTIDSDTVHKREYIEEKKLKINTKITQIKLNLDKCIE